MRQGVGGGGGADLELPADEELVQDVVRLVEVEDDVQLAHVAEVTVEHLHEQVDLLQGDELVVVLVYARHEKQGCVPIFCVCMRVCIFFTPDPDPPPTVVAARGNRDARYCKKERGAERNRERRVVQ